MTILQRLEDRYDNLTTAGSAKRLLVMVIYQKQRQKNLSAHERLQFDDLKKRTAEKMRALSNNHA